MEPNTVAEQGLSGLILEMKLRQKAFNLFWSAEGICMRENTLLWSRKIRGALPQLRFFAFRFRCVNPPRPWMLLPRTSGGRRHPRRSATPRLEHHQTTFYQRRVACDSPLFGREGIPYRKAPFACLFRIRVLRSITKGNHVALTTPAEEPKPLSLRYPKLLGHGYLN